MEKKPDYWGHRERLRERLLKTGAEGFHDYEIIELLLTYAFPRKDVKPVAKKLIKHFGSLSNVLDASVEELQEVPGLTSRSAFLIPLVKEASNAYLAEKMKQKDLLTSPQAAVEFARAKLVGRSNESFMVIYVNTRNEAIDYEILHEGTLDSSVVYPRRIIEGAINHHASGLLLVHNHPSGHTDPSSEDKHITQTIIKAARTMDIHVLDHVIVGKGGYFSFAENRLLEETI
ncbi:MAG: DNA repair protein RadC [Chloroflexota bacterium]|nr:DNA repair protein RadC [Chloroflexota bacterium]